MAKKLLTEKVTVNGKSGWSFVVYDNEGWTLLDPKGKPVPAPGLLPDDEIERLRYKAKGTQ